MTPYRRIWDLQKKLFKKVSAQRNQNYLIFTEHEPVLTIGKSGDPKNLVANADILKLQNISLIEIDRGGDITYHGPGQIVGYPILDLSQFREDIGWYLRCLEEVNILSLRDFGITGTRIPGLTGVWVGQNKICAIGIKVTNWVSMHGFALNISPSPDHFQYIVPCGIRDKGITSVLQETGNIPAKNDVINSLCTHFEQVFSAKLEQPD